MLTLQSDINSVGLTGALLQNKGVGVDDFKDFSRPCIVKGLHLQCDPRPYSATIFNYIYTWLYSFPLTIQNKYNKDFSTLIPDIFSMFLIKI